MIAVHSQPGALTPEECDAIAGMALRAPASAARLVGQAGTHDLRRARLVWVDDLAGGQWIMDRLSEVFARANRDRFGFDLTDFAESAQVARYDAEDEGHFDWHSDIGEGRLAARRKLTAVVQLSRPEDYAGGALEIRPSGAILTAGRAQGTATVFPSYLLHRVSPVTAGRRLSLTLWAHGPAFR